MSRSRRDTLCTITRGIGVRKRQKATRKFSRLLRQRRPRAARRRFHCPAILSCRTAKRLNTPHDDRARGNQRRTPTVLSALKTITGIQRARTQTTLAVCVSPRFRAFALLGRLLQVLLNPLQHTSSCQRAIMNSAHAKPEASQWSMTVARRQSLPAARRTTSADYPNCSIASSAQ